MSMPRRPYLTTRAHEVFALAHDVAEQRGDVALTAAHLALGLLRERQGIPTYVLSARGVPLDVLGEELTATLPPSGSPRAAPAVRSWTPEDEVFVAQAIREASELGTEFYGAEHLLLALLRDPEGVVARVLAPHGVGYADVRADVRHVLFSQPDAPPRPPAG